MSRWTAIASAAVLCVFALAPPASAQLILLAPVLPSPTDVVKVIDAIKGAGANPVGLQVDDLP